MSLLESGAQVRLISPEATPKLKSLASEGKIDWVQKSYGPGDLSDSLLVIAATDDPTVNQEIYQEAKRRKVLLNVVDAPKYCTFIAPSIVRQGDITLAISTSGKSPALAYLDVIAKARQASNHPLAAYNVSGEYAMVKAAARNGWLDEERVTMEILTSIKRAGADIIVSYHAKDVARLLQQGK